jgi:hypothetical protein
MGRCRLIRGDSVHYSAGLAGLTAIGGAAVLPGSGALWLGARLLLDGAGALFGLYLLTVLALFLSGYVLRRRRSPAAADHAIHEPAAGVPAAGVPAAGEPAAVWAARR